MAFGGPRSSCVRPGAHSARHQDSHNDWTPCCMAERFVSADETLGPTATRGSSHSARRLRSLAFLCSSKDGVDPIEARQAEPEKMPTFTTCAARYIRAHRHGWKNAKHARQWVSTLKTYARPEIGSKKVDAIATENILKILSPIWTTKTETAKRVQGHIENIRLYRRPQVSRFPGPGPLAWPPRQAATEALACEEGQPPSRHAPHRGSRLHGGAGR